MRIGLYYCHCGMDELGHAPGPIDVDALERRLVGVQDIAYFERVDFICSEDGCATLQKHLEEHRPDRVLITVCSVREHEDKFRVVLQKAGINPYFLQVVNVREHVAWVTDGAVPATEKAIMYLRAAARRVQLHEPLQSQQLEISTDVLIIGGGPAGLKAALTAAEAGRKVAVVEAKSIVGGLPVRFEDLFPTMECGSCLLEPLLADVLHGPAAQDIELMLTSEVAQVSGSFGNFLVKIRQRPRYVSVESCVGCGICMEVCPASLPNPINLGRTERKAIDVEFLGGLPNVPFLSPDACLHFNPEAGSEPCTLCRDACPVDNTILLEDLERTVERRVGAIIVAVGGSLYDCSRIPNLGYATVPDVYDSFEFERILCSNGPTEGELLTLDGKIPEKVAIFHCVGSLDENHKPYCSGICCLNAFKLNHLIAKKAPDTKITHFYKTIVAAGKEEYTTYDLARRNPHTEFVHYRDIADFEVKPAADGRKAVHWPGPEGQVQERTVDMVVLMPATVPSGATSELAKILDLNTDATGFLEEMHGRTDASRSGVRGIYLAGSCQGPKDLQRSMTEGVATAGYALSGLVPGRTLTVSPIVAIVDETRCSGCRTCIPVCPYKAISRLEKEEVAYVNPVLCVGCGACVAACPAAVIKGSHFTNEEIFAEIEELLA